MNETKFTSNQNKMHLIGRGLIRFHTIYFYHMDKRHSNLIKIGKKIREMRKLKHFSQEELAAEAGLGRSYYGRIERGEQNISIQNLIQIAITLQVEVKELIPPLRHLKSPEASD